MADDAGADATGGLRVTAAFALLAASAAGVLPPLLVPTAADGSPAGGTPSALRLKAFAGGVMLSLAVLHVIADSFERLSSLSDFPWAGVAVIFGILFMFFVERMTLDTLAALEAEVRGGKTNGGSKGNGGGGREHADEESGGAGAAAKRPAPPPPHAHAHGHAHGLLLAHPAARKLAMAHLLEASILVHSVIIGLDLGVSAAPRADVIGLTAVLGIHQFFEGISLGSVIADLAGASARRKLALAAAFSCTTPLGVLAGVALAAGVAGAGEGSAPRALALAGTLDGVTGACLHVPRFHLLPRSRNTPPRRRHAAAHDAADVHRRGVCAARAGAAGAQAAAARDVRPAPRWRRIHGAAGRMGVSEHTHLNVLRHSADEGRA
jgi:zinc transporter ZupT